MNNRFEDQGELLSAFRNYRIISCPGCSKPVDFHNSRISCMQCGYNKQFEPDGHIFPVYPSPMVTKSYLTADCCGQELWAFNLEHLEFIEDYVRADIRTRQPNVNQSLLSRLPQWIKSHKNRTEILKCIQGMKEKLQEHNYKRNSHIDS